MNYYFIPKNPNKNNLKRQNLNLLASFVLSTTFLLGQPAIAEARAPEWTPQSSERLIQLPATYLKKSIDSDFAGSELGSAINSADSKSEHKILSLVDLKDAVDRAEGKLKTELRHQFLVEKKAYLDLMVEKNNLNRKRLRTKKKLFGRMLRQLTRRNNNSDSSTVLLVENQNAAQARFASTFKDVDLQLFRSGTGSKSKYSKKYSENMAAIEGLVARLKNHRMSSPIQSDGKTITKEEYIRHLLAETEGEIAILEQEQTITAYMAKLVALDAMSLSEEALSEELAGRDASGNQGPAEAIQFFLTN